TTAALLAGKLLEQAEYLLDKKIHPTVIVKGYRKALEKALEISKAQGIPVSSKETLKYISMTAMTGKGAEGNKELLAGLIVDAVEMVADKELSKSDITIVQRKGENVNQSELVKGIVIDKEKANAEMPSKIENAKILLIDSPLELKNPEQEAKISVSTPEQLEKFLIAEEQYIKNIVQKIIQTGANVLFCQKGIDDVAQYYLARAGILACRRVSKNQMEKLARATSSKIVSNINEINASYLGFAEKVEEIKQGFDSYIYIQGCRNPKAVTIVIRGGSEHVLAEIERALTDGIGDVISAIKSGAIVAGGGAFEIELSKELLKFAKTIEGREQLAIESFSKALESIPETLAENAGLDPLAIVAELKKFHDSGNPKIGINLLTEKIEDTFASGVIEPLKVKTQAISSAAEVAMMILRIDDVLISKPQPSKNYEDAYDGMD
ncbi:MAG: thermosome subunit alpha, partial [Nanoarchaeota archaeon]